MAKNRTSATAKAAEAKAKKAAATKAKKAADKAKKEAEAKAAKEKEKEIESMIEGKEPVGVFDFETQIHQSGPNEVKANSYVGDLTIKSEKHIKDLALVGKYVRVIVEVYN